VTGTQHIGIRFAGFAELNELRRNNYMSKRAGNYFSGRTNRMKSEINHAASQAKGFDA